MNYIEKRKTKGLFSLTIDKTTYWIQIRYNLVTDSIKIRDGFHLNKVKTMYSKIKRKTVVTKLPKPPQGYVRHHIAYHLDDLDKGVVVISRSLHGKIHNPLHPEYRLCIE